MSPIDCITFVLAVDIINIYNPSFCCNCKPACISIVMCLSFDGSTYSQTSKVDNIIIAYYTNRR